MATIDPSAAAGLTEAVPVPAPRISRKKSLFRSILTPFGQVPESVWMLLAVAQGAVLVLAMQTVNIPLVPTPGAVASGLMEVLKEGVLDDLGSSLWLNFEALVLTSVLSLALSYLHPTVFFQPLTTLVSKLRFAPMTGLSVVFSVVFGNDHYTKLALLTFGMTVFFVTAMNAVVETIPKNRLNHARSLGFSPWRVLWEVVILGKADQALEILRQVNGQGYMMLTMVEGIALSGGGIGAAILRNTKHQHVGPLWADILCVVIAGMLFDVGIVLVRQILCRHAYMGMEKKS